MDRGDGCRAREKGGGGVMDVWYGNVLFDIIE